MTEKTDIIYSDRKQISGCLGPAKVGSGEQPGNGTQETSGVLKVFCLVVVVIGMVYTFVRTHWPKLLKWVSSVVYKLYLYNADCLKTGWGAGMEALAQRSFFECYILTSYQLNKTLLHRSYGGDE